MFLHLGTTFFSFNSISQVLENWRNRPQEQWKDKSYLDVFCQQVKICIEIALNCVETNRHKRPSIEDIISKLNESETMIEKSDKVCSVKYLLYSGNMICTISGISMSRGFSALHFVSWFQCYILTIVFFCNSTLAEII